MFHFRSGLSGAKVSILDRDGVFLNLSRIKLIFPYFANQNAEAVAQRHMFDPIALSQTRVGSTSAVTARDLI